MRVEVGELTEDVQGNGAVGQRRDALASSRCGGSVGEVGDEHAG